MCFSKIGLAMTVLVGATTFAQARPPTVMNSPGYDRRLQESRSQLGSAPAPANQAVTSKRGKKKRPN